MVASGQAEGRVTEATGPDGKPALRLDYDFHDGGGFVVARREVQFMLPETFEIAFSIRGTGLGNHFEFKVADAGSENAWRCMKENFQLPIHWQKFRVRERDLPFAWGPAGGGPPKAVGAFEFAITAGPGGKGCLWLSDITIIDQTLYQPKEITATSHSSDCSPSAVFETGSPSGWRAAEDDPKPRWTADFGRLVRFGGLVITWPHAMPPREFYIELSDDQKKWTRIYQATHTLGLRSHVPAPGAEARYFRISFANAQSAALVSLDLRPDAFSEPPNEFIHAVVADFPRGWFPRYWYREQSYWTPIGSPEGKRRALINEEGLVEVDEAGFSLEPFLCIGGKFITWADAEIHLSFPEDGSPLPTVVWSVAGVTLTVLPWVEGCGDHLVLCVAYRMAVDPDFEGAVKLSVAVRPYQVNPPWQAFRNLGGRSPIHHINSDEGGFTVGGRRVSANKNSMAHGAAAFEEGGVVDFLSKDQIPSRTVVEDALGLASAAMTWEAKSPLTEIILTVPFFQPVNIEVEEGWENNYARWKSVLSAVEWQVPTSAKDAFACFRTAAAHILINRDGPAIQPGPRRYTRSWIRDCVIMGSALAKAGLPHALREFLTWFVQFQRDSGEIPCVVDRDGVDDLVEHDSHGQFLWGLREVFRDDGDASFIESMRGPAFLAAEHLIALREERMTEKYRMPEHQECFGLLPESASHEGYLAHPVHSYWDDFWGITGLEAAADLAEVLGDNLTAERWHKVAKTFCDDVLRSIEKVIESRELDYIPGSVEWADFDPTATANAIAMLDFADALPQHALNQMMVKYLDGFHRKRSGQMIWKNYSAYEIRIIGALVRMGQRDKAHELLNFFLSDRRPVKWNQWPEITWRDPRAPGHLGDIPHTWIAAEYLLALASMVASERERTDSMVLAAGLSWEWISQENGIAVRGLPTRFGRLNFAIRSSSPNKIEVNVGGEIRLPPGGLSIAPPLPPGQFIGRLSNHAATAVQIVEDSLTIRVMELPFAATLELREPIH